MVMSSAAIGSAGRAGRLGTVRRMLNTWDWILAAVVTASASMVQGTIGFGLGVVSVPILTLIDPSLTPIPQLLLSLPLALATAAREHSRVDTAGIGLITVGRVPGALGGAWLLTRVSEQTIGIVIGVVVLAAVVASRSTRRFPINTRTRLGAGLAAGFSGTTSGIGGPPIALLYRGADTETARSTVAAAIAVGLVVNLTVLHLAGAVVSNDYRVAAILGLPMVIGFLASSRLRGHVDDRRFRAGILALSAAASIALLARSVMI